MTFELIRTRATDASLVPLLLDRLQASGSLRKEYIKYVTHRV